MKCPKCGYKECSVCHGTKRCSVCGGAKEIVKFRSLDMAPKMKCELCNGTGLCHACQEVY